jgi:tRNA(Arg) A34 adenosine deaminase TadA
VTIHKLQATCYDKLGRVISVGANNYTKTHPVQSHFAKLAKVPEKIYLHAEIAALLNCKDKKPYSIFIERYTKSGAPALAAPCPACLAAIKAWGISKISYTI